MPDEIIFAQVRASQLRTLSRGAQDARRRRPRRVRRPGPQRPTRRRPTAGRRACHCGPRARPDDQLLAAELARLDRKLEAPRSEDSRLIDLYQAGLIDIPELQRAPPRSKHASANSAKAPPRCRTGRRGPRKPALQRRRAFRRPRLRGHPRSRPHPAAELLRLLIEDVRVTGWHVKIQIRIALDDPPLDGRPHGPAPRPSPAPADHCRPPLSTSVNQRPFAFPS